MSTVPVNPQLDEYVIESFGPDYEGWFPFGEISLIAGSSGSGKTTVMIPLIERASRGEDVFGHRTKPRTYKILLRDRSLGSFNRTLRRLKASNELLKNVIRLTSNQQLADCSTVIEEILDSSPKRIDLLFIEGIDMWCHGGDASDFNTVCALLDSLQDVAERWHVAIVASIGAPKQKAKDRYELLRDSIYGTVAWGRKTETIMFLKLADLKNPDSPRECIVLPRQGKSERYLLTFEHGQLVETNTREIPEPTSNVLPKIRVDAVSVSKFDRYLAKFKTGDVVAWNPDSGMSRATFYRDAKKAQTKGKIYKANGEYRKAEFDDENETKTVSPPVSVSSEKPFVASVSG